MKVEYKRGDIVAVELMPTVGSVQGGNRLAVVIQNDKGNNFAPTLIIGLLTTKFKRLPTHVIIRKDNVSNLKADSMFLGEQILTVDKRQIISTLGKADNETMTKINDALMISIGLIEVY